MITNKSLAKFSLFGLIAILALIFSGQIIAQLYTIRQLNKVKGKVINTSVAVTSFTSGRSWKKGSPNYSFIISLNSGRAFAFEQNNSIIQLENNLRKGDDITIYYPTTAYDIFSLNILEFGHKGSQIEYREKVIYSFVDQKNEAWPFIVLIAAGIVVACYRLYGIYNGE